MSAHKRKSRRAVPMTQLPQSQWPVDPKDVKPVFGEYGVGIRGEAVYVKLVTEAA